MPNRQQRRAAEAAARKAANKRLTTNNPVDVVTAPQGSGHPILEAYQRAAGFQKIVTELYDHVQETLRWAPADSDVHRELTEDGEMLAKVALESRQHTLECGLAFLEAVDPRPKP